MSYITLLLVGNGVRQDVPWVSIALFLGMALIPIIIACIVVYRAHRKMQ